MGFVGGFRGRGLRADLAAGLVFLFFAAACSGSSAEDTTTPPPPAADSTTSTAATTSTTPATTASSITPATTALGTLSVLDVSGIYQFVGEEVPNTMKGTITFDQEGDLVRVTGTTYEDNPSRELKGEATIKGTRLEIVLVPINDDPTYEAEVLFIFSEDGNTFEVSFTDTNGDEGSMESYTGVRQ